MKDKISARINEIIETGERLIAPGAGKIENFWVRHNCNFEVQGWLSSAANILQIISPQNSIYLSELKRILDHNDLKNGIPAIVPQKMLGLLKSAREEWSKGLLRQIEYIIVAGTFDDFLDHSESFHKSGKKIESAVLASAILEDTIKKIARKNELDSSGSLEPVIEKLITADVLTPVKGKRIKSYAGIRNKALHAEWDAFDIKDVGEMIKGLRELLEDYL